MLVAALKGLWQAVVGLEAKEARTIFPRGASVAGRRQALLMKNAGLLLEQTKGPKRSKIQFRSGSVQPARSIETN